MRIRYNSQRSSFYDEIESVLKDSSLDREITVLSNQNYSYAEEEIEVVISDGDDRHFLTNWWKAQASLFPARAKALGASLHRP